MKKEETMSAVQNLREALSLTQTDLALKIGRGMSTIQRWERVAPPRGEALVQLMNLAVESGHSDIAKVFQDSLSSELGHQIRTPERLPKYSTQTVPDDDVHILDLIFLLGGKAKMPEYEKLLNQWHEMTRSIRLERSRSRFEVTAISGLLNELKSRIESGESDAAILQAMDKYDPAIVENLLVQLRQQRDSAEVAK